MARAMWRAGTANTLLSRLCSRDGTGGASPNASEGNLNASTDFNSLTIEVWDLGVDPFVPPGEFVPPATEVYPYAAPVSTYGPQSLTPSAVVTALQTGGIYQPPNTKDALGCNFLCDLPASAFPTGGHIYRAVLTAVTTGGTQSESPWQGRAEDAVPPP